MTPISSTIPMSSPLFFIILFPSWFLWSYLFNFANAWRGLHLAYLLGSSPLLKFVTSLWHRDPWHPLWLCFLCFFFVKHFKQGCLAGRYAPKIKIRLGGFWYPLLMFHFIFYSTLMGAFKKLLDLSSLECFETHLNHQQVAFFSFNGGIRFFFLSSLF